MVRNVFANILNTCPLRDKIYLQSDTTPPKKLTQKLRATLYNILLFLFLFCFILEDYNQKIATNEVNKNLDSETD